MSTIESRLAALGLQLPAPIRLPAGVKFPFQFVRIAGTRAFISGHGPQNADGSLAQPLGKLGSGADRGAGLQPSTHRRAHDLG